MGELVRFGVSIDSKLLSLFDDLIAAKGYTNRSEAIRDLIRDRLVETRWERGEEESIGIEIEPRLLNWQLLEALRGIHQKRVPQLWPFWDINFPQ